jgi:hypothetical protein
VIRKIIGWLSGTKRFTHRKRGYKADVIIWDESNTDKILPLLNVHSLKYHNGEAVLIVRTEEGLETLRYGSCIVKRENNTINWYKTLEEFNIQYEEL